MEIGAEIAVQSTASRVNLGSTMRRGRQQYRSQHPIKEA